jgi:branched-chain amino acid transport system permease protein
MMQCAMQEFFQAVVSGAGQGSLDAMLALGIVLIFRTTGVMNFAQASTGTVAAFALYSLAVPLPLWLATLAALIVAAVVGLLTFAVVRGTSARQVALTSAVASLAVAVLLQYVIRTAWGTPTGTFPNPFGLDGWTIGGVVIAYFYGAAFLCALVLALLLGACLRWTKLGVMIRALADQQEAARLFGANEPVLVSVVWAVSGMLAGVAAFFAMIITFQASFVDTFFVGALIAAVIGGLRSLTLAFVGALGLEIARNLFVSYAAPSIVGYTQTFLLILLIIILTIAPRRWLAGEGRTV